MSKFTSKYKYMYDAAPQAELIAKDGAAHTASFNSTSLVLPTVGGWWNQPKFAADFVFAVAVNVHDLDQTTGDETYVLELEFGTAGYASAKRTQKLAITKPGQYVFLVDMDTAAAVLGANPAEMRIAATLAGTTPAITLNAWLAGQVIDGL